MTGDLLVSHLVTPCLTVIQKKSRCLPVCGEEPGVGAVGAVRLRLVMVTQGINTEDSGDGDRVTSGDGAFDVSRDVLENVRTPIQNSIFFSTSFFEVSLCFP